MLGSKQAGLDQKIVSVVRLNHGVLHRGARGHLGRQLGQVRVRVRRMATLWGTGAFRDMVTQSGSNSGSSVPGVRVRCFVVRGLGVRVRSRVRVEARVRVREISCCFR